MLQNVFISEWSPIDPTNTSKQGFDSEPTVDTMSTSEGGDMPLTPVGNMCCPIVPHQVTFGEDDTVEYIEPPKEFNNYMFEILWGDNGSEWYALWDEGPDAGLSDEDRQIKMGLERRGNTTDQ